MAEGYGFGAEGDWKTAILVRVANVMGAGLPGGASLMEDYTYDLVPGNERILGAHMLEVSPSLTTSKPRLEVHALGIGGKEDPVRLVFTADPGPALVVAMSDMRDRFRLVANVVENVEAPDLPKLPVGRAVWKPEPDFATSAAMLARRGRRPPHGDDHRGRHRGVPRLRRDRQDRARRHRRRHHGARLPERAALEPGILSTGPGLLTLPRAHLSMRTLLSGTQHALRAGDYEAVIASVGASLRSLTYDGRDLVVPFDADEVRPSYRGATLAPWPNRVVDGKYTFAGVERQVALTEPARHHALHGLGGWLDYEAIDKGPSHVTLAAAIEPQTGYPWRIVVETTFALDADGLTQTVKATQRESGCRSLGHRPAPVPGGGRGARRRLDPRPAGRRGARGHARPADPDRAASGRRRRPGALRLPRGAADRRGRDRPRVHRARHATPTVTRPCG